MVLPRVAAPFEVFVLEGATLFCLEYDAPNGPGPVRTSDLDVFLIASSYVLPTKPLVSFE